MATPSGLTPRQQRRVQFLRQSGQKKRARRARQQFQSASQPPSNGGQQTPNGPQTRPLPQPTADGTRPAVRLPKPLAKQFNQGSQLGEQLIDRFLPDLDALGTVDAGRPVEIQNILNELRGVADVAGDRSQQSRDVVSSLQDQLAASGQRSGDIQSLIDLQRGGLGGLSSVENEALREEALRNVQRGSQASNRALARLRLGPGSEGQAAALQRDILRDQGQTRRDLERDILLRNIDIQDRRRDAFGNLVRGVEGDEFARQQQAAGSLGSFVTGLEAAEFDRANRAREAFAQATERARADELSRELFNLEQQRRLLAGQQSLFFGGQSLLDARRNALRNFRQGKRQIDIAQQQADMQAQAAAQAAAATNALLANTANSFAPQGEGAF